MITVPAEYLTAANLTHAPRWRASLLTAAGYPIMTGLPVLGGTLTKDATQSPRNRARVDLPTQPQPGPIDQNMIPVGQRLVLEYSIEHFGTWVTIADLDVVGSAITRPDSIWSLEAIDRAGRVGLDDTARGSWVPQTTGTIAAAIEYIVRRTFPGTVFEFSGPALTQTVPADSKTFGDTWDLARRMAQLAGSEIFFRAHDRVCVVRPVPDMGTPVDSLSVGDGGTITQYTLRHEMGYSTTAVRYLSQDGGDVLRTGLWVDSRTDSPVAVQRIGSHVVIVEDKEVDVAPSQADADAAALALGRRAAGRSRSPSIRHVSRPWLEPGDTVNVTYSGGPTEAQIIDALDIPLDNTNIQTTVLRTHEYSMGVPV